MSSYREKTAWLATMHEKLELIAPAMQEQAGLLVQAIEVDTDQLGTFSGEIPRVLSPLEAVIAKAKLGLNQTGGTIGIASEGSIGPDPQNPFMVSNIEIVALVDLEKDLVIHESYRSFDIAYQTVEVLPGEDLSRFLESIDFPNQGLIARAQNAPGAQIIKGITDHSALESAIKQLFNTANGAKVLLEPDFRAHQSPSRRANIAQAAKALAKRVATNCPDCRQPGFGKLEYKTGLTCEGCGMRKESAIAQELLGCVSCEFLSPGKIVATALPVELCDWCNP